MAGTVSGQSGRASRRVFVLVADRQLRGVFLSWEEADAFAEANRVSLEGLLEFTTRSDHPDVLLLCSALWDRDWEFVGQWASSTAPFEKRPQKVRLDYYQLSATDARRIHQRDFPWQRDLFQKIDPLGTSSMPPVDPPVAPPVPDPRVRPPRLSLRTPDSAQGSGPSKPRLRLKHRTTPPPIPRFAPQEIPEEGELAPASVVLDSVHEEMEKLAHSGGLKSAPPEPDPDIEIRSLQPYLAWFAVVACWALGLFLFLQPRPTATEAALSLISLAQADLIAIEPGQVFFQLKVPPIHQRRWSQSLGLEPIPGGRIIRVPQHHALSTWAQPAGYFDPPFAESEVRDWWELRFRKIINGYYRELEDGGILVLDLNDDLLIGWAGIDQLKDELP